MMRAQKQRIMPLLLLNLILAVVLFFVLDHFGVVSWKKMFFSSSTKKTSTKTITEDPFLLEREALRKRWLVLEEKERLYKERQVNLLKTEKQVDEKLKEADREIKRAKEMQVKLKAREDKFNNYWENVSNVAQKIGNMPPANGKVFIENMVAAGNAAKAVDVLRQMDSNAEAAGKKSITAYLLSLMDAKKASTLMRLMLRYPREPKENAEK